MALRGYSGEKALRRRGGSRVRELPYKCGKVSCATEEVMGGAVIHTKRKRIEKANGDEAAGD